MVKILPVVEEDARDILPLIQEYFPYYNLDLDKLVKRIQSPKFWFHKSIEKNQLTGFAEWEIIDEKNKILRLNGIAVFPRFQGKGYAHALMRKGEEDARVRGIKKITLLVGENNQPAKELYEKNEYQFVRMHSKKIAGQVAEVWEKNLT